MSNTAQYKSKLEAYTEGRDFLAMQSDAPRIIADLIAGLPERTLRLRPLPDKWSVAEIIAHLAEDELISSWRYRQMIETSGCPLAGFDQDVWARIGDYVSWKPSEALQLFRLLREARCAVDPCCNERQGDTTQIRVCVKVASHRRLPHWIGRLLSSVSADRPQCRAWSCRGRSPRASDRRKTASACRGIPSRTFRRR